MQLSFGPPRPTILHPSLPNGKIYFFDGSSYYSFDIGSERMDPGCPRPICGNWPGLEDIAGRIQGAVAWPNGLAYFFSGDSFYTFDIAQNQTRPPGPLPVSLNWKGVLGGPQGDHSVDAAVIWDPQPNGLKAYLFQFDRYYRFDVASRTIDPEGYPLLT